MTRRLNKHHPNPTPDEAELILELWMTKKFDTFDIGRFLDMHESVVSRTIHAARDLVRMLHAEAR